MRGRCNDLPAQGPVAASLDNSARCASVAIFIGTAGWSIPRDIADRFPSEGTALQRYAARFPVAEINSSFHRPHRISTWERWRAPPPPERTALHPHAASLPVAEINSSFHRPHRISTWERWRDSVPDEFRFSVKLPKAVTHQARLADCAPVLDDFLAQASVLGIKLAVLLVQLPPRLELDPAVARAFFAELRRRTVAEVACEPRNGTWFTDDADALLRELHVARVAADPAICTEAATPGGGAGAGRG